MEKFSKIKEYLGKYKSKYLINDISIYNKFVDKLITNIDNKYYKSLLDLEKYKPGNSTPSSNKNKNKEIKIAINNSIMNELDSEKMNQTFRNNIIKTHRKITSDTINLIQQQKRTIIYIMTIKTESKIIITLMYLIHVII